MDGPPVSPLAAEEACREDQEKGHRLPDVLDHKLSLFLALENNPGREHRACQQREKTFKSLILNHLKKRPGATESFSNTFDLSGKSALVEVECLEIGRI
jgi:hypothetical protein